MQNKGPSVMEIKGFFNEFRFLSNFWPCQITWMGIDFPSTEHAYQAAKTLDVEERERIASLPKPRDAKAAGYKVQIRPKWDEIRLGIMRELLQLKFADPELRRALVMTHPASLEETNRWGDIFWGVCNGEGENHLGRILMELRDELKPRSRRLF